MQLPGFSCQPLLEEKTVKLHVVTPTGILRRGEFTLVLDLGRGTDVCRILANFLNRALECSNGNECLSQVSLKKRKPDALVFTLNLQKQQVPKFEAFMNKNRKKYQWYTRESKSSNSPLTSLLAGAVGTGVGVALGSQGRDDTQLAATIEALQTQTKRLEPIAAKLEEMGQATEQITNLGTTVGMLSDLVSDLKTESKTLEQRKQTTARREEELKLLETKLQQQVQDLDAKAVTIETKVNEAIATALRTIYEVNPLTQMLEQEAILKSSPVTEPKEVLYSLPTAHEALKKSVREFSIQIDNALGHLTQKGRGTEIAQALQKAASIYNDQVRSNIDSLARNENAAKQNRAEILAYKRWNNQKVAFLAAVSTVRQNTDPAQQLALARNTVTRFPLQLEPTVNVPSDVSWQEIVPEVYAELESTLDLVSKTTDEKWESLLAWEKTWGAWFGTAKGAKGVIEAKTWEEKMSAWRTRLLTEATGPDVIAKQDALDFVGNVILYLRPILRELNIRNTFIYRMSTANQ